MRKLTVPLLYLILFLGITTMALRSQAVGHAYYAMNVMSKVVTK
jgi:hypothetical protein